MNIFGQQLNFFNDAITQANHVHEPKRVGLLLYSTVIREVFKMIWVQISQETDEARSEAMHLLSGLILNTMPQTFLAFLNKHWILEI